MDAVVHAASPVVGIELCLRVMMLITYFRGTISCVCNICVVKWYLSPTAALYSGASIRMNFSIYSTNCISCTLCLSVCSLCLCNLCLFCLQSTAGILVPQACMEDAS